MSSSEDLAEDWSAGTGAAQTSVGQLRKPHQLDLIERAGEPTPKRRKAPAVLKGLRKETGSGLALLAKVERAYPNDSIRQLSEFFSRFNVSAGTGRSRRVSFRTMEQYQEVLNKTLRDLADPSVNMRVHNLTELSAKHVRTATQIWVNRGASASYLASQNTALRRLAIWMGKPDAVPRLCDLVGDPQVFRRSYSALTSKNWETMGIDIDKVFADMDALCPITGLQLRLILVNGLRAREAMMFKPAEADKGDSLLVTGGTKGGRTRTIPVDNPVQRDILERCKAVAKGNARGLVTPRPGKSVRSNLDRFYYLLKKIGVTKKQLGVTPHGLRHTYAARKYEEATGMKSPVDGGGEVSREADHVARLNISELLGHSRKTITSAYLGTHQTISRARMANLRTLLQKLEGDPALKAVVDEARVGTLYVVGPAAEGRPVDGSILLGFELQESAQVDSEDVAKAIEHRVGEILRCIAVCVPWARLRDRQPDTLELAGLTRDVR
ncbi:MAG: integrase domain-containing protein [Burkholderiaceae bacterium]|nr:integrase domain-containing protein [Burkholderiaceae bacterium]MDP3138365.1 integrase domain-containing protein [Burkholderiaceae bacterium]